MPLLAIVVLAGNAIPWHRPRMVGIAWTLLLLTPPLVAAAGILLVREAGGFVTDLDGGDAILTKGHVGAGNDTMHRELLRLLKEAGREAAKVPEP